MKKGYNMRNVILSDRDERMADLDKPEPRKGK